MKKRVFVIGVISTMLIIGFSLVGCATAKVYDKSVPLEQSSVIKINECFVREFNGNKTDSKWWAAFGTKTLQIPAGKHTLEIFNKVERREGGRIINESGNINVTYTFIPGRTYLISAPIYSGKINAIIIDESGINSDLVPDTASNSPFEGEWAQVRDENIRLIIAGNEYATKVNGQYTVRGFVNYTGGNATLQIWAMYDAKKEKWAVSKMSIGSAGITSNGNTLILGGQYQYRKVK